jgi:hypothetical protein
MSILDAFNRQYAGREFIYRSKYGRTRGVVKEITLQQNFIMNEDRENAMLYLVNKAKGRGDMKKPEMKGEEPYMAYQPVFQIISTKGIVYDLVDCFFIEDEN